ncbi:MAG TPA: methyl-accepting chemotaxis protein [Pseudolabrys sp.]|nr:methyl-accepting chemotaxis protein [Pseudolabrys sp.]
MSAGLRSAVLTNRLRDAMRGLCLPALLLAAALQAGEFAALYFDRAMLATGLGAGLIFACLGAVILGRLFRQAANAMPNEAALRVALDACRSNLLLADSTHTIVHANAAMLATLQAAEGDLHQDHPAFDIDALIGSKLGALHKRAISACRITGALQAAFETELKLGARQFRIVATPILDNDGRRNGTVVEWLPASEREDAGASGAATRAALDVCRTGVMVTDDDDNIVYVNKALNETLADPAQQRRVLSDIKQSGKTEHQIGDRHFRLVATPLLADADGQRGTVVEWQDETDRKNLETASARMRSALDVCRANLMAVDENWNIVYVNDALVRMFRGAEADVRNAMPHFDCGKLLGQSTDVFHKDPVQQRRLIELLSESNEAALTLGTRQFQLRASPAQNGYGQRLGTIIEWRDMTVEQEVEAEIDGVVKAALAGDLTGRLKLDGKIGFTLKLATALNDLCESFAGFIGEMKDAAYGVKAASREISSSTTDLSQRTETQAASLEETSASMEEIATTVRKNAENAQEANRSAIATREVAGRGGEVVAKAVDAMAMIDESSRKVSDIIGVIDEIARQTNLLALNAAVEAARAGEAGRGFAVVASEVRSLAQRASQAAKDIKDLITNSNSQVQEGVGLVNKAGTALTEIVESIERVTGIVSEIATASAEQATGIAEVNKALTQMDEMTQQNSALVQENAATAKTLEQQSRAMDERVDRFTIAEAPARAAGSAPAPRVAVAQVQARGAAPTRRLPSAVRPAASAAKDMPKGLSPRAAPKPAPVAGEGGPVNRLQAKLAAAVGPGSGGEEQDWKEF